MIMTNEEQKIISIIDRKLKEQHLNNQDISKKTGYSSVQIGKWRSGKQTIKLEVLLQLFDLCGIERLIIDDYIIKVNVGSKPKEVCLSVQDISGKRMSSVNESTLTEPNKTYFQIAESFRQLFIKNLKDYQAPTTHQDRATYKNYADEVRLMVTNDGITRGQFLKVWEYLNGSDSDFWKKNILSIKKLRKQFHKLVMESSNKKSNSSLTKKQNAALKNSQGW